MPCPPRKSAKATKATKATKAEKPVQVPPSPPRPTPLPWEWATSLPERAYSRRVEVRLYQSDLGMFVRDTLRVPSYQRGVVWDAARQVSFCRSAMACRVAPTVTVLRYRQQSYVLDGQQRLTALGLRLERIDGTTNQTSAGLDVRTGQWVEISPRCVLPVEDLPEQGTTYLAAEIARGNMLDLARFERAMSLRHMGEYPPDVAEALRDRMSVLYAQDWCRTLKIPLVEISLQDDTPGAWDEVLDVFRMVNTPGVSFDLAELERVLAGGGRAGVW